MAIIGTVPRRSVNLPPGALRTLIGCAISGELQDGPAVDGFYKEFGRFTGSPFVLGAGTGRSVFQLALEALGIEKGKEIIVPAVTFPVMPMVVKLLGYKPVFCDVDPNTYNAGPKEILPKITENTGAILATHLFGQPCDIEEIAEIAKERGIYLIEDCAHACGVRVNGKSVGTFGDIGIFSFAEGKNMPCFAGGAITVRDAAVYERAAKILETAAMPSAKALFKKAFSIWIMWVVTRPLIFGLTAYQALRFKQWRGEPLMDSAVGNELLEKFAKSNPRITRFANLQGALGLKQLKHIDAFNQGAKRNAEILTEALGEVPGVQVPRPTGGNHIYVYYPLTVDPARRDDLRDHLLRDGVDAKRTDMSSCAKLAPFADSSGAGQGDASSEAALLEICVYPVISQRQMRKIGRSIRAWAGLPRI